MRTHIRCKYRHTDRHATLMLGKQRERANKRNKLTVAQPYPVMHVLDIPLKCRPVMRKSSINLVCASHPGWQLWQIISANGQKMNDNTSFYCARDTGGNGKRGSQYTPKPRIPVTTTNFQITYSCSEDVHM